MERVVKALIALRSNQLCKPTMASYVMNKINPKLFFSILDTYKSGKIYSRMVPISRSLPLAL